jgi:hypothetical protein
LRFVLVLFFVGLNDSLFMLGRTRRKLQKNLGSDECHSFCS